MKNPFLDMLKPTSIAPETWVALAQEQQMDVIQTSMAALTCRDPMALVALQQAFVQRTVERWTQGTRGAKPATAKPASAKAATAPTPAAATPTMPAVAKPAAAAKPVPTLVDAVPAKPDDLTAIKGIGPKFAATLAEHGITTYQKLASLSAAEIEALEEKLGFAGRFAREGWVEQAKALAAH